MGSLARQSTVNITLQYTGIVLGFVNVVLLYPRILAADQYGLTRLLVSISAIAAQVASLGLDNTVLRYFPYFRDPARRHRGLLGLVLLAGLAGSLLAMLVLGLFHGVLTEVFSDRNGLYGRFGLVLLPLVLAEVFFIVLRAYSRSLRRSVQPTFIRELLLRLLQMALILVQWRWTLPFGAFMMVYTAVFLACTLALLADLWRAGEFRAGLGHLRLPSRLRRSMTTYGSFALFTSLAAIAQGNLDQMMIGALLGDGLKYVAYYAVAYYFGSVIAAPSRALNQLAVPLLADAWRRRDLKTIGSLYARSAMLQLVIGAFIFVCIWASLDDLFMLLPAEYTHGQGVVMVIAAANLFSIALGLNGGIITMSRGYRFDALSSLAMLGVTALSGFFLIRSTGIVGAAWATLIALVAVNLLRLWFLYRRYGLWPFSWRTALALVPPLGVALIVPWIPLTDRPVADLVLRSLLIAALYWPAAHVLKLTPELVEMARRIGGRITPGAR